MKKLVLIVLCTLFWACTFAQSKETRNLPPFEKVKIRGLSQVIIQKGNEEKIELASEYGSLESIKVRKNKKGYLIIEKKINFLKEIKNTAQYTQNVKAVLTLKNLSYLSNSGAGSITVHSPLQAETFILRNSGSGSIQVRNLEVGTLEVSLSGSGDIKVLKGSAQKQNLKVSGSGSLNMLGLESKEAETKVSGSGSLYLYVAESHTSKVSGSGSIYYKGNPESVIAVESGSGSVKKIINK